MVCWVGSGWGYGGWGAIRSVSHGFSPQRCVAACAAARLFDGPSMHLINGGGGVGGEGGQRLGVAS